MTTVWTRLHIVSTLYEIQAASLCHYFVLLLVHWYSKPFSKSSITAAASAEWRSMLHVYINFADCCRRTTRQPATRHGHVTLICLPIGWRILYNVLLCLSTRYDYKTSTGWCLAATGLQYCDKHALFDIWWSRRRAFAVASPVVWN